MKLVKVSFKAGRGNSGDYDLTIHLSPEVLKTPPLTKEGYKGRPKGDINSIPFYDNKPIMEQPLSNPDRDINQNQIVVRPHNFKLKYSGRNVSFPLIADPLGNSPMIDDEPNQWGTKDARIDLDTDDRSSIRSTKSYALERNKIAEEHKLFHTKKDERIEREEPDLWHNSPKLLHSPESYKDSSETTYPVAYIRDTNAPQQLIDVYQFKDDVVEYNPPSPRLGKNRDKL